MTPDYEWNTHPLPLLLLRGLDQTRRTNKPVAINVNVKELNFFTVLPVAIASSKIYQQSNQHTRNRSIR